MLSKAVLVLVILGTLFVGMPASVRAEEPEKSLTPYTDPLPSNNAGLAWYYGLTMHMFLNVSKDNSVQLSGVRFSRTAPKPAISRPVQWLARGLSFDNTCDALIGLEHPRVIQLERSEDIKNPESLAPHGWHLSPEDSERMYFNMPVTPGLSEVEIIDDDSKTVGVFNVDEHINAYCGGDPDNPLCKQRWNYIVKITDPVDMSFVPGVQIHDFSQYVYDGRIPAGSTVWEQQPIKDLAGGNIKLRNAKGSPIFSADLSRSDISGSAFLAVAPGFEASGGGLAHNIHDGGAGGYVQVDLADPVSGIAMNMGSASLELLDGKQGPEQETIKAIETAYLQNDEKMLPELWQKLQTTGYDRPIKVSLRAYGESGEFINSEEFLLPPIPGIHLFAGVVLPFTKAKSFQIEFETDDFEELIDDLHMIPAGLKKVRSNNFNKSDQPCAGDVAARLGPMSKFNYPPPMKPVSPISVVSPKQDGTGTVASGTAAEPSAIAVALDQSVVDDAKSLVFDTENILVGSGTTMPENLRREVGGKIEIVKDLLIRDDVNQSELINATNELRRSVEELKKAGKEITAERPSKEITAEQPSKDIFKKSTGSVRVESEESTDGEPSSSGGSSCQLGASGGPVGAGGLGMLLLPIALLVRQKMNIRR